MRFVTGLFALLLASLPFAGGAAAAPEGKRIALLGTSNTNPYIGAWTSTFSKLATAAGMKVTNLNSNYDAAVQSQQIDDAIRTLRLAQSIDPKDARPRVYLGVLAARRGRYDEAIEEWQAARRMNPAYPNIDRLIAEAARRR